MQIRLLGRATVVVVGLALLGAACSSDNSSSSTTTAPPTTTVATTTSSGGASSTASAALCSARDALQQSIQNLTSVDVVKNGTASLQTALGTVKTNLQAVKAAATAQLQPQVTAFEDSLQQVQTALGNSGSGGLAGVATSLTGATRTGAALLSSLQALKCS